MADFTTILNRGIRRYVDKYLRRREFGRCESCGSRALIVRAVEDVDGDKVEWSLCPKCYDGFVVEDEA